jgi:hypothetical protein
MTVFVTAGIFQNPDAIVQLPVMTAPAHDWAVLVPSAARRTPTSDRGPSFSQPVGDDLWIELDARTNAE